MGVFPNEKAAAHPFPDSQQQGKCSRACHQIASGTKSNCATSLLRHRFVKGMASAMPQAQRRRRVPRCRRLKWSPQGATTELLSLAAAKQVALSTNVSWLPRATWAARRKAIQSLRLCLHSSLRQSGRDMCLTSTARLKPSPSGACLSMRFARLKFQPQNSNLMTHPKTYNTSRMG
jgi:hypothetical protein